MRQDSEGHSWKSFWGNVKNWIVKKKEKAANKNNITTTIGITGSAAFGGGVSASLGVTQDTKGNLGFALTTNGGGGFPNVGGGAFVSVNNTPTIYEQSGLGTVVGASGGPWVVAIGGEYNMLINQEKDRVYHGATISATAGLYPTVVEVHGEVGYTWVRGVNMYDIAIKIADFMGGN